MIRFRPHRSMFDDSMKELKSFDSTDALITHIQLQHSDISPDPIKVNCARSVYDPREGWKADTYYVLANGQIVGMADQPVGEMK